MNVEMTKTSLSISIEQLFQRPQSPAFPGRHGDAVYWLERQPKEKSRVALVKQTASGDRVCVTPAPFNISNRVHEYGGNCFVVHNDRVIFSNKSDLLIYQQLFSDCDGPKPITYTDSTDLSKSTYADFEVFDNGRKMVVVREKSVRDRENQNTIAWISLNSNQVVSANDLICGSDFVVRPTVSPDGRYLAWISWNHPNMPWDESTLNVGELTISTEDVQLNNVRVVAGGAGCSVCQLGFLSTGELCFAMDIDADENTPENFWNLYLWSNDSGIRALTQGLAEYGEPHWILGHRRWAEICPGSLLAVRTKAAGDELVEISLDGEEMPLNCFDYNCLGYLWSDPKTFENRVMYVGSSGRKEPEVVEFRRDIKVSNVIFRNPPLFNEEDVHEPKSVWFDTRDGDKAHAYLYLPVGEERSPRPLMVIVHGGPTARAYPKLSPINQYYLSLGFAILDVNHRGSTGFGRKYRKKLNGEWGCIDVDDVADAIEFAVQGGYAMRDQVCIRGGSAGGYVVLRMVTRHPEAISVGVSYYGIGNLATLAAITHKFESKYVDVLIGDVYSPDRASSTASEFYQRSPINYIDQIQAAIILFQGLDDEVVPPKLSQEVIQALKAKGLPSDYIEFQGEGHGFNMIDTKIDSFKRETEFILNVMGK